MNQLEGRQRLQILYQAGITSPKELQIRTGMPRSTIFDNLRKIRAGESLEHGKGAGRPPLCNANDRRRLAQLALTHPHASAVEIGRMAVAKGGPALAERTIQSYLIASGIEKLRPKQTLDLTDAQKQKRVEFCEAHINDDFSKTFFQTRRESRRVATRPHCGPQGNDAKFLLRSSKNRS